MNTAELIGAISQLEREKGIDKEYLFEAIEAALAVAYKKNVALHGADVKVEMNREDGSFRVFKHSTVVENGLGQEGEYDLDEAKAINPEYEIGDVVVEEIDPTPIGRIAAQNAKQTVLQKIREAESGKMFTEYKKKVNSVVTGIVIQKDSKSIIVDIGISKAILPANEQIEGEDIKIGDKLKLYVAKVDKTTFGADIVVSRTNSGIVGKLFENEVPEIADGTVEIKSIAREPGSRTKIAVYAENPNVDPVGACVGQKGSRVQVVVDALGGEKIDVVRFSPDAKEFIAAALSPAQVLSIDELEEPNAYRVMVPSFQLSLAIGKMGQNARLAAKLTGWKIDIKPEENISLEF